MWTWRAKLSPTYTFYRIEPFKTTTIKSEITVYIHDTKSKTKSVHSCNYNVLWTLASRTSSPWQTLTQNESRVWFFLRGVELLIKNVSCASKLSISVLPQMTGHKYLLKHLTMGMLICKVPQLFEKPHRFSKFVEFSTQCKLEVKMSKCQDQSITQHKY